jgi:alanine racemase
MVRCGLSLYGLVSDARLAELPLGVRTWEDALEPALSLKSRVSFVKTVDADEGISYGLRYATTQKTTIATVPIGYADGVPRSLGLRGGEVLIGGHRLPVAGLVTMDQLMVDCGDFVPSVGDEVVLLGSQRNETIGAWKWAEMSDTIAYEVVCQLGKRVPRLYR